MADIKVVLSDLAKEVAKLANISLAVRTNNQGLPQEDPRYTFPIDNDSSFGKISEISSSKKAGYGTLVIVNQSNKRDVVMRRIWKSVEIYKDSIIKLYVEGLLPSFIYQKCCVINLYVMYARPVGLVRFSSRGGRMAAFSDLYL